MSDEEENKQEQESPASTEPPEPVLSAVTAPREDQIQNAVAFLSHPKVRGSSTESKRSFLQKKGLTEAEIVEAVKRVPESSDTTVGAPSSSSTAEQLAQVSRPQKPFPTGTATGQPYAQQQSVQAQQALQPAGYRWSQIALGAGLVAVTVWGVQRVVVPYATSWYRSWTGKPDPAEQNQAQIATILADAIKAQTAELRASVDSMKEMLNKYEQSRSSPSKDGVSMAELRQELLTFANNLNDFRPAAPSSPSPGIPESFQRQLTDIKSLLTSINGQSGYTNPTYGGDTSSVSRQLPFGSQANQRGSPGSLLSGSTSPQAKHQATASPFHANGGSPDPHELESEAEASPEGPPHPANYMDILNMLQRGEDVPGIKDIDDKPPNPDQPLAEGKMKPRPKPWERASQNGSSFFSGKAGGNASGSYAGSNGVVRSGPTARSGGVEITEVANTPEQGNSPTANGGPAPWRPPPVPQSSLNLAKHTKTESVSSA